MKKSIFAVCFVALAAAGCGESSECQDSTCRAGVSPDDLKTQSQAIKPRNFGERGGSPYGSAPRYSIPASGNEFPAELGGIGKSFGVGLVNNDDLVDLVYSAYSYAEPSKVRVNWSIGNSADKIQDLSFCAKDPHACNPSGEDAFGQDIAVGKFCPNLAPTEVIIASAPAADGWNGAFTITYGSEGKILNRQKQIKNALPGFWGEHIAVADVDNDGKNDLIYSYYDMADTNGAYVLHDVCNASSTAGAVLLGQQEGTMYGSAIYVADLNGKGEKEILVVDPTYGEGVDGDGGYPGAVFFYKYDGKGYVQSRDPLIGEVIERPGGKSGGQISSVAFSDLNGDGLLDLIVGEPYANDGTGKRAGRVRTYTNTGTGFDVNSPLWQYNAPNGKLNFGSEVKVVDLNGDGVADLVVGAPGMSKDESGKGQQGHVFIFLGTKDGSIFSKEPYWTYVSNMSTDNADLFGSRIVVADLDKGEGWLDLVIGAPGNGAGRIDIFMNSEAPCYTADGCLIDGVCYESGETSPESKCQACDPMQDNFGFSEVTCAEVGETACTMAVNACDDKLGCQVGFKPDGTVCGDAACTGASELSTYVCESGKCEQKTSKCDAGLFCTVNEEEVASCWAECMSDADCAEGMHCYNHRCEATISYAPVITKPKGGEVFHGSVVFEGTAPASQKVIVKVTVVGDESQTSSCEVSADEAGVWRCEMMIDTNDYTAVAMSTVGDKEYSSDSVNFRVELSTTEGLTLESPTEGAELNGSVVFSGKATAGAEVSVRHVSDDSSICSGVASEEGIWSCTSTSLAAGEYSVYAYVSDDVNTKATPVSFRVKRTIPVITSPESWSETSIRPTFKGTVPGDKGSVSVWQVGDKVMTRFCVAPVMEDGTFQCTTGFDLEYGMAYTARATWVDESSVELTSEDVEFVTSERPTAAVEILLPADGAVLTTQRVIFSGVAEPYKNIVVYCGMKSEGDGDGESLDEACRARTNGNGRWACSDRKFAPATYTAYAVDERDSSKQSKTITFRISDEAWTDGDMDSGDFETSGGSCSALPNSTQRSVPLMFLAMAGALGFGVIRRRRA